jgi:predicted RNA polymerase sigma factor
MDNSSNGQVSLKQLFQLEFTKMVAVISKLYGLQHIEIAEDVVSDTFLLAAETWGTKGMPANPTAWLYTVAKHKTMYHFRRSDIFQSKVIPELKIRAEKNEEEVELDFSGKNIRDSQLRMLFAVCNPAIASEAQIGLALRILCGFGIDEIAEAFLSNKETINKRLFRAKEKLRTEKIGMEMPPAGELAGRLDNVLHVIYLLFNEGYYSRTKDAVLRKDLCLEAMRLALMLTEDERTDLPETNALLALMCFHASRLEAREGDEEGLILYDEQDERLWDMALVRQGMRHMELSAAGHEITSYHLEAAIAYWHCRKEDTKEKWTEILRLYDQLLKVNFSPSVALNRVYALYKARGREAALTEALKLGLENDHFYFLLLGELYKDVDNDRARNNLEKAYSLAKTQSEKQSILKKIGML